MEQNDQEAALECLKNLTPIGMDYHAWLNVGMALQHVGLPCAIWDNWSQRDPLRYEERLCEAKWAGFRGSANPVGVGTLVKYCRDQGHEPDIHGGYQDDDPGHELAWDAEIGVGKAARTTPAEQAAGVSLKIVRQEWLEDEPLPDLPAGWDGRRDLTEYLKALFNSGEYVGIVTDSWQKTDEAGKVKYMPKAGVWDRTAGDLIERLGKAKDLGAVVGDWDPACGAWIRFNPLDGQGCKDANITEFRFCLVESDHVPVERQHAIYQALELPIAALVHSGGKSLHAIVRIDAGDAKEFRDRVDYLYQVCEKNGLKIDRNNRNPSRLSRLPGATRNGNPQRLVATKIGKATWAEWKDWIEAVNDDLPEIECVGDYLDNLPPLAPELIHGVLRRGHKLLVTGAANTGKSFCLIRLAIAVAEGGEWLGFKVEQGRVLYVNLELDRASCLHRIYDVYEALGKPRVKHKNIDAWQLRGYARSMTDLTPRLIRRAAKLKYDLVIIDPIYKVLDGDENTAVDMAKFCNQFDKVALHLGAAVAYVHHHSKGAQGSKNAADRSSGSGVFKRDPDALIDLVELEVNEARREQLSNRWQCDAMAAEFDKVSPDWRIDCPQDILIVAKQLAAWADANGLGDAMRFARPPAIEAADGATACRIECGTLREFRKFKPRVMWFRYPLHVEDKHDLLKDARAEGEVVSPQDLGRQQAAENREKTRMAIQAIKKDDGTVSCKDLREYLECEQPAISKKLKAIGWTSEKGFAFPRKDKDGEVGE
jgi:RecA-family ATPase